MPSTYTYNRFKDTKIYGKFQVSDFGTELADVAFDRKLAVGDDVSMNSRLFVGGDASLNSRLLVVGDVSMNSRLFVGGDADVKGSLSINGSTVATNIYVQNNFQSIANMVNYLPTTSIQANYYNKEDHNMELYRLYSHNNSEEATAAPPSMYLVDTVPLTGRKTRALPQSREVSWPSVG